MGFRKELETELENLKNTRKIMLRNPVFINEEIGDIDLLIMRIEIILSVLIE